jgi:hypothetical protein
MLLLASLAIACSQLPVARFSSRYFDEHFGALCAVELGIRAYGA